MFLHMLLWLILGGIIGLIATAAHLQPASWYDRRWTWVWMGGLGMLIGLGSGCIGAWWLGKYFAVPVVLWITIAGMVALPRVLCWLFPRV